MGSHLNRPIYPPEEKFVWFQTPIQTGGVRHANVPWMIHIFGSGADEHIELSMWLRALPAQLSGARSTTELIARREGLPKGGLLRQKREKLHPFPFDIPMPPHHRGDMGTPKKGSYHYQLICYDLG